MEIDEALCPPVEVPDAVPGGPEADEVLARLAKALGHPVRAGIVRLLASRETCQYGDLTDRLPLAKSTVSQHLKVLSEAGLVRGEVDGPRVCYCIDPSGLRQLKLLVDALEGSPEEGAGTRIADPQGVARHGPPRNQRTGSARS